jgi:hypothetical protein
MSALVAKSSTEPWTCTAWKNRMQTRIMFPRVLPLKPAFIVELSDFSMLRPLSGGLEWDVVVFMDTGTNTDWLKNNAQKYRRSGFPASCNLARKEYQKSDSAATVYDNGVWYAGFSRGEIERIRNCHIHDLT